MLNSNTMLCVWIFILALASLREAYAEAVESKGDTAGDSRVAVPVATSMNVKLQ